MQLKYFHFLPSFYKTSKIYTVLERYVSHNACTQVCFSISTSYIMI